MIRIITLLVFIALNSSHGMAAPLLTIDTTFRRGNLEIDLRQAHEVLTGSSLEKANEIFAFFEEKITPIVPSHLQNKISKRWVKIEFQKDLEKGALFIDHADETQPLLLRVRSTLVNDPSFYRLLSHEWFHALHFVVHKDEPAWLREGLAQVFEHLVLGGYNGPNLIEALEYSTTRLDHEFKIDQVNREAYGHVFIYFYYLYQKCGKQAIFWKLVESTVGKFADQSIDGALSQMVDNPDYCADFNQSVIHAELARFHNRKIKNSGISTEEYLIVPELSRNMKSVLNAQELPTVLPQLPKWQPKFIPASVFKVAQKYLQPADAWAIYTLGQSTPYAVKVGADLNVSASPADLIFVMKIK